MNSADPNLLFRQAEADFRKCCFARARTKLNQLETLVGPHNAVLHLLALTERQLGHDDTAEIAFRAALDLTPTDAQIWNNYANCLADQGKLDEALEAYDTALISSPAFLSAAINRALLLDRMNQHIAAMRQFEAVEKAGGKSAKYWNARASNALRRGDYSKAETMLDRALDLAPTDRKARRGKARIRLERGFPDAANAFEFLVKQLPDDEDIAIGYAQALLTDGRGDDALAFLAKRTNVNSDWLGGVKELVAMRWELGESQSFIQPLQQFAERNPSDIGGHEAIIAAFSGAEMFSNAADAAAEAASIFSNTEVFQLQEATLAGMAGDLQRADDLFARLNLASTDRFIEEGRHRIRIGQFEKAELLLSKAISLSPDAVTAWALIDCIWRLKGDPRHEWLHGQVGLITSKRLSLPSDFIEDMAQFLRKLHRTHAYPLGNSVRNGTQTRGILFRHHDKRIATLQNALEAQISQHWHSLPAFDATHPLLKHRNGSWKLAGSWSVRLTEGGFHTHHVHPQGILSSACYFAAPDNHDKDAVPVLEIGRPPPDLNLELEPLAMFQPSIGSVVLFPSTAFHGTRPVRSGERLTVAFDVVAGES